MFSIITVSHGHERDCQVLFTSLAQHFAPETYELIVVDNLGNSDQLDRTLEDLARRFPQFSYRLIKNESPKSFSHNNNLGVAQARHEKIVLLNPDIVVENGDLARFVLDGPLEEGRFYFPTLLNRDGTLQTHKKAWPNFFYQCAIVVSSLIGARMSTRPGDDWAFAAAVCFTKTTFAKVGGFDTNFGLYCEDVEIAHRLQRMGGKLVFIDDICLVHGLGGEAKSKYMKKAIVSNFYLRYAFVRNAFLKRAW